MSPAQQISILGNALRLAIGMIERGEPMSDFASMTFNAALMIDPQPGDIPVAASPAPVAAAPVQEVTAPAIIPTQVVPPAPVIPSTVTPLAPTLLKKVPCASKGHLMHALVTDAMAAIAHGKGGLLDSEYLCSPYSVRGAINVAERSCVIAVRHLTQSKPGREAHNRNIDWKILQAAVKNTPTGLAPWGETVMPMKFETLFPIERDDDRCTQIEKSATTVKGTRDVFDAMKDD